ncbi:hypothetical protein CDD81_3619 [Ophiocordyceps australis]|uniref:GAR domain-containing protein n=1 Tax=Ophiocordyceps australis TaxID=1399860 RepID=A0A2C5YCJ2_9HYPO|nr:hypothetical protein CDD81_3619 [Ophiocordyceps australis]
MADPSALLKPKRISLLVGQPSPRPRHSDDILTNLGPSTAVDALTSPTGALRVCLDGATTSDNEFAMEAALASKKIWEWVSELSQWPWPTEPGSAGFETPEQGSNECDSAAHGHLGRLSAHEVEEYQNRINQIDMDLDKLHIEDLKSHVMSNHIMPLSRPTTPVTDCSSSSSYTKMEDLTAVVTAIVVQLLPNLAKLSRLLRIWSIRLTVLRRIPAFLYAIQDAEVGLKSGWTAISQPHTREAQCNGQAQAAATLPTLDKKDFDVMSSVLVTKVSEPGRILDYMLDYLEGTQDTLPDAWLQRMEDVERDYGAWVAACERKMQEVHMPTYSPTLGGAEEEAGTNNGSRHFLQEESGRGHQGATLHAAESPLNEMNSSMAVDRRGSESDLEKEELASLAPSLSTKDKEASPPSPELTPSASQNQLVDSPIFTNCMSPVEEEDEMELPPLRPSASRTSLTSQTSTLLHGESSQFDALSSDPPEMSGSPRVRDDQIQEPRYITGSQPSSPMLACNVGSKERPVGLLDSPMMTTSLEEGRDTVYKTPADQSFVDEFDEPQSASEMPRPMPRRESSGDRHLRQQISDIIESIPAKIQLATEATTPPVNLNPPDFQMPRLIKKQSKERVKRSVSSMSAVSSRTTTPSFTLSPAKNPRPRHQRSHQEIKVYHLSRSTGEPPIKLFIRCVGERGERVMVRVGGGWADLSEYLKEYASHHGRRSAGKNKAKVEVRDVPRGAGGVDPGLGSSPPRPVSRAAVQAENSPTASPLAVAKARRSAGAAGSEVPRLLRPKTPAGAGMSINSNNPPSSGESTRSRSSSRLSWVDEEGSFLGLAGPTGKKIEMSEENRAWVESVKEKVRLASGERRVSGAASDERGRFGELGTVGSTKRLFPRADDKTWR